jgi:resuscitation-promoting factor RpfB
VLLVQETDLGIASKSSTQVVDASLDPGSNELFAYELSSGEHNAEAQPIKLASAIKATPKANTEEVEAKVEAITITKPAVNTPADIEGMVRKYAAEYGANPDVMMVIAKCESGYRADAVSPSGAYKGMYQFVTSTWQSNRRAMGLDDNPNLMFNAEEAIKTAAFKMGRDGYGAWPACSQKAFSQLALN